MRKQIFKTKTIVPLVAACMALLVGQSCTDLEPTFNDSIDTSGDSGSASFGGVASSSASLEALYTSGASSGLGIYNTTAQTDDYALSEVAADNIAVLTRGADWSDNGVWRVLHAHTWDPNHQYVLQSWNKHNAGLLLANQLLDSRSSPSAAETAQAQVIKAFHIFTLVDFFGKVPFRDLDEDSSIPPTVLTAQEAIAIAQSELDAAIASGNLSTHGPEAPLSGEDRTTSLIGVGQAAALFMRARLNLNLEVLTGTAGDMNQVISDVNAIEDLGFELDTSDDYFDIWNLAENVNQEVIMALNGDARTRIYNMTHPNQGGWNGFVTMTETFRLHGTNNPAEDARVGVSGESVNGLSTGYIRGQQVAPDGTPLTDRQANPLVYEDELLTSLEVNNERNGLRIVKYPVRSADGGLPGDGFRDYVWMRFTDAALMRAEAGLRGGTGATLTPLEEVNAIRARAGAAALGSLSLDDMPDVIARELNGEGVIGGRRIVQRRFGLFTTSTWEMKTVMEDFRDLYPIPGSAVATNPNLIQNDGY
nr:RagB/SusD family nutrient uptake outer membrane protein [uncultured Allomuricauda sp.]